MSEENPIDWARLRIDPRYLGDRIIIAAKSNDPRDAVILKLLTGVAVARLWQQTDGAGANVEAVSIALDAQYDLTLESANRAFSKMTLAYDDLVKRRINERSLLAVDAMDEAFNALNEAHDFIVDLVAQNRTLSSRENAPPAEAKNKPGRSSAEDDLLSHAGRAFAADTWTKLREADETISRLQRLLQRMVWEIRTLRDVTQAIPPMSGDQVVLVRAMPLLDAVITSIHEVAEVARFVSLAGFPL